MMDWMVHRCRDGFYFGRRYSLGCRVVWPWRRRAVWGDYLKRAGDSQRQSDREASRLRSLGASVAAIDHCCYRVGSPPNSAWRRWSCWLRGDFSMYFLLHEALRQNKTG